MTEQRKDIVGVRWSELERRAPTLAEAGREFFFRFGTGLAYLATIRRDGAPRIHPMCPVLAEDGLFAFIVPSPKREDLLRDGRYAMHAFPADEADDEFAVAGTARPIDPGPVRDALVIAYGDTVLPEGSILFEFDVERLLLARYRFRGDWPPTYTIWPADD